MFLDLDFIIESFNEMDPKLGFIFIAFVFGIPSFVIYFMDMIKGPTQPHPISWLIWFLCQVLATYGAWLAGGGYGVVYGIFYCVTTLTIFIYSAFTSEWKKIDREDWVCLGLCIVGLVLSLVTHPFWAVLLATSVEAYGYRPTFVKLYYKPRSEPLSAWILMIPTSIFIMLSMGDYNPTTLIYYASLFACTVILVTISLTRRRQVQEAI